MRGASLSINAKKTIDSQWVVTKEEDVVYKNGASNEAKMLRELFWRKRKRQYLIRKRDFVHSDVTLHITHDIYFLDVVQY